MKGILLIITIFMSWVSGAQSPFDQTAWAASDRIEGVFDELILHPADTENIHASYYHLDFRPGFKFFSYNVPGCGMDCVVHVNGSYEVTGNKIRFVITSINRYKGCRAPEEIKDISIGTYYWIKDEFALRIVKNLEDEPRENYFEQLQIKIPVFHDEKADYLMRKYVYTYNRCYRAMEQKKESRYKKMRSELQEWSREAGSYKIAGQTKNESYQKKVSALYQVLYDLTKETR